MGKVAIPISMSFAIAPTESDDLLEQVDFYRRVAFGKADIARRSQLGQYPTSPAIAAYMASLFAGGNETVRLLDANAGVGSLTAAYVADAIARPAKPIEIVATTFELDPDFADYLRMTLEHCEDQCRKAGVKFTGKVEEEDFIAVAVGWLQQAMFAPPVRFDKAILNPP